MSRTGLTSDPAVLQHDTGPGHPERAERFEAVLDGLEAAGLFQQLTRLPVRSATDEELQSVHTSDYLALVERETARGDLLLSTGDANISRHSEQAARAGAGSVLSAVDAVFAGTVQNAFCNVRPPGHHASAGRGMGFCLYNSVAVAARHAQKEHGVERVLIVDWDVHHGNGTQDIFYEDGSVLFFSTHQSPWYPGTGMANERGSGAGSGTTINCPFNAGAGRAEIVGAVQNVLLPVATAFKPNFILLSAGFDSRAGDPLGQFTLQDQDFEELTRLMLELADRSCQGRLVSVLEGGYSLPGLVAATQAHVRSLLSAG